MPTLTNPQSENIIKTIPKAPPTNEKIRKAFTYLPFSLEYKKEIIPQTIKNKEKTTNQKTKGRYIKINKPKSEPKNENICKKFLIMYLNYNKKIAKLKATTKHA